MTGRAGRDDAIEAARRRHDCAGHRADSDSYGRA